MMREIGGQGGRRRISCSTSCRCLNLPATPEKYLQRLEAGLTAGLAALAEAVGAGAVVVEDGEFRLPRRKPAPRDGGSDCVGASVVSTNDSF
jgi:hypothetical protein